MERTRGFSHSLAAMVGLVWLAAAVAAGWFRTLEPLPRPVLQGILFGLTALLLIGGFGVPPIRAWLRTVPLRALVGLHLSRIAAGAYFLMMYREGRLPHDFAVPGGWGDIAVGVLALGVIGVGPGTPVGRRATLFWNILGLIDILFVVFTAARLGLKDADSMVELTRLPLCVLPLWLVPMIIASHIVIFARLRAQPAASPR